MLDPLGYQDKNKVGFKVMYLACSQVNMLLM